MSANQENGKKCLLSKLYVCQVNT